MVLDGMIGDTTTSMHGSCQHLIDTTCNPQANGIVECIHQMIGQVLRTVVKTENPCSVLKGHAIIDKMLATAMHACHCVSNHSIGHHSLGALAFHHDMHMDIPFTANILALQHNLQIVDQRLLQANSKHIPHDCKIGNKVLKKNVLGFSDKLVPMFTGPYNITRVHTNGTVTVKLHNNVKE